jgi:fucose permease
MAVSTHSAAPSFLERVRAWAAKPEGRATILYCGAFASLGLCLSSLGPALLDLSVQVDGSLRDTSYSVIVRSFG